jgi:hypothetical protein
LASQVPSDSCTSEEARAFGFTLTLIVVATKETTALRESTSSTLRAPELRGGITVDSSASSNASRPGSAAAGTAAANSTLGWTFLSRRPWPSEPLLDVGANHPPNDLRGSEILLGAQLLEDGLLAWINQDRQARGALFELYDCLVLHLHWSYIVE